MQALRVLILGGTGEAAALARLLVNDARFAPVMSLAGRTRTPAVPPIPWRSGGFGGAEGLAAFLREQRIEALIDATHPFAETISRNAVAAAAATGVPLLTLSRPEWQPTAGDRWTIVPDLPAAAAALGPAPRRVFLAIGRQELAPFAGIPWHSYVIRSVEPPAAADLPPGAEVITARGPFEVEAERRLLADRGIEVIVAKNSGGTATAAKLLAARALGLAVILAARPPPPARLEVDSPEAVRDWLLGLHATLRGV